jgi:carbamoyltransferase
MSDAMKPLYVLGLGYSTHDSSACLMRDGEIVVAIAKERITRFKHDGGFSRSRLYHKDGSSPWDLSPCIDYCLDAAGIGLDDVDLFVENHLMNARFDEFHRNEVARFARPYPVERTTMISHHLAHAYSTYYASGFDNALVMVVDGEGNSLEAIRGHKGEDAEHYQRPEAAIDINPLRTEKISIYSVSGGVFKLLRKDFSLGSIGGAYQVATIHIFDNSTDAGKTMGLAPFGRPNKFPFEMIASHDGNVKYPYITSAMVMDMPAAVTKWPEDTSAWTDDQRYFADLAWKIQDDTELALVDVARAAAHGTGHRKLAIAGGVGLNSVANKKIRDALNFDDVYVIPPCGDDGLSIGCAYWGTYRGSGTRAPKQRTPMRTAALGRVYSDEEIAKSLAADPRLHVTRMTEAQLLERTVAALAEKNIIGWFYGGSEIGPRALGHRSILADARVPDMKAILNRRVKFREAFRPFAPVIPLEQVSEFFEMDHSSPYMLMIAPVIESKRSVLPSITHVDGTARVQTVTEAENGRYYRLVKRFGEVTGVPVLVNTSFNIKGEPIVETPREAVECFLCNDIDYLVLGDYWVERLPLEDRALLNTVAVLNPRVILQLDQSFHDGELDVLHAAVFFRENVEHKFEVTAAFHDMLTSFDGRRTIGAVARALADETEQSVAEAEALVIKAVRQALSRNLLQLVRPGN